MQGKNRCRLSVLGIAGLIVLLAWPGIAAAGPGYGRDADALAMTAHPAGLVIDFRATAYTVDTLTGKVFCLPAGNGPVHYATISGQATALSVDRCRTLYVGTTAGSVLAVDRDGTVREAFRCSGPVKGLAVDRDGGLLIATDSGTLVKKTRAELTDGK